MSDAAGREANQRIEEILTGDPYALDDVNGYLAGENISNAFVRWGDWAMLARGRNRAGHFWRIGIKSPLNPEIYSGFLQVSDNFVVVLKADPAAYDILCAVVIMDSAGETSGETANALARALLTTNRQGALEFYMNYGGQFDFEMILFYKSETHPRGYEIISTNVIFDERN